MKTQGKSKRTVTGAIFHKRRKKKKYEMGREILRTKLEDEERKKIIKCRGKVSKIRVMKAKKANVFDPKSKKSLKLEIKNVLENAADSHFVRRNIITKGAIIDTEKGKARVTSRPSQDGTVNAVLI
jgi:small subunit ribosomal protein S8e